MKIIGCFFFGVIAYFLLCAAPPLSLVARSAMPRRTWTCLSWVVILSLAVAAYAVFP